MNFNMDLLKKINQKPHCYSECLITWKDIYTSIFFNPNKIQKRIAKYRLSIETIIKVILLVK